MKVILLENIKKLGKRYEVKNVTNGYGRNFLIPQNKAVLATTDELQKAEELQEIEAKKAEEELQSSQKLADQLDGIELEIQAKAGDDGKLFGAIGNARIAEELGKIGINVEKESIKTVPIKELGDYDITIELPHGLEITLKVIVLNEDK